MTDLCICTDTGYLSAWDHGDKLISKAKRDFDRILKKDKQSSKKKAKKAETDKAQNGGEDDVEDKEQPGECKAKRKAKAKGTVTPRKIDRSIFRGRRRYDRYQVG